MTSLEAALRAHGLACRVEARDRLAILVLEDTQGALGGVMRQKAVDLARDAGFTHVAVELDGGGAPLPRD